MALVSLSASVELNEDNSELTTAKEAVQAIVYLLAWLKLANQSTT